MRFPVAVAATIFSIALYFTLFWGFDALRILTSPVYGLEDSWRSQIVYWIGRSFNLGPSGLLHLAAVFGIFKLAVAGVCAVHIVDRGRAFAGGRHDPEILEIGLLLVVIASIVSVAPALWEHDAGLIRTNTMHLVLASIAAALSAIERLESAADENNIPAGDETVESEIGGRLATAIAESQPMVAGKPRASWFSPWR